jgi:DNA-directed RNA polymerase I and III subunit RPAC1
MSDEIMANRIGLVPIKLDPRFLIDRPSGSNPTDLNTVVMELSSKGSVPAPNGSKALELLSSQLQWIPQGTQESRFAGSFDKAERAGPGLKHIRDLFAPYWKHAALEYAQNAAQAAAGGKKLSKPKLAAIKAPLVRPVHGDIVITKINRNNTVALQLHAVRGVGREHAKWTPVELANYRLLPHITLLEPIEGEAATRFQKCFEEGVIEVVKERDGRKVARVANARNCGMNREVLRHKEFVDKVVLSRKRDHFICK